MTHLSQIFRSRNYKVLESFSEMKGKTVIGVFTLKSDRDHTVVAFVNEGTLMVLDNGSIVGKTNILESELKELETFTGITESQLL